MQVCPFEYLANYKGAAGPWYIVIYFSYLWMRLDNKDSRIRAYVSKYSTDLHDCTKYVLHTSTLTALCTHISLSYVLYLAFVSVFSN